MRINLKLIAAILAIGLWLYVNIVVSPIIRRTLTAEIEYRNIPPLMRVHPEKAKAEVVLTGTRRDFIIADRNFVQLSVDLYNLRPGKLMVPIKVTTPPGLSVVSVMPPQIEVLGEPLVRRELDVTVEVKGQTDEGFLAEPPVVTPHRIIVEGIKEQVDKVASAQVSIKLNNARNSLVESCIVTLLATSGEIIEDVKTIPEKVNVAVTVKAGYPTRIVPVKPQFLNKPPEGFKLDGFEITPPEAVISGPPRILEQTDAILTMPIDLARISSSGSITALLKPSIDSLKVLGSDSVTLSIRLVPAPVTRVISGLPLTLKNSADQHCLVTPSSYTIVLKGFVDQLEKVSQAALNIILDIKNMPPGSYSVNLPCPVGLPQGIEVVEIQPSSVHIEITEIASESEISPPKTQ